MNLFQIATRGIDLDTAPITPDDAPPRAGFQFEEPAAPQQRLRLPTELDEVFALAAAEYDIDPNVLRGVAYAESRFNPDIISGKVKSPAGAIGLMQFMPETAKEFGVEPTDPAQSIIGAAAYLRKSLDKFGGDYERAVASYNWGPNRKAFGSDDWVDKAPEETRKYLGTVFDAAVRFRDGQAGPTAPHAKTEATQLPAGVTPSTAGAGRGAVSPGMTNTKLVRSAVPEMTAESLGRDVASGVLQIGPTAVQGVGDLLSLATGNRVGSGLREFAKSGKQAIQEVVGSERAQAQAQNLAADMADDSVGLADLVANNKGALSDQILPTLGSMAIPLGAAGAAGKLATAGKAAQGLDKAAIAARVASAQQAAGIGATAAQNAASTFAELLDKGVPMQDAYVGAGITVPFSLIAGKLTGGGAEGALIRGMGPAGAARGVAEAALKAPAREGLQEGGEALGQVLGEAGATSTLPTLNSALKQVGTEALLGAVVGGGMSGAQQVMMPRVEAQPITPTVPQVAQPNQAATPPNSDATKTQAVDNIAAAILEAEGATSPVAPVQPTEKQAASFAQRTATPTPLPGAVPTAKAADADVRSLVDDIKKKRAQDAEETAQIQQMLAEDDAKAEALASSSMEETARGQAAQIAIQARARLVDDLVSSYAEPSEFFASRVLPAVDRQLAVLGRPPLAKDERARVDALLGSTRAFIRPSLPSAPESAPVLTDFGADNSQLESLIKPKKTPASGIGAELAAWKARQQSAKPVEAPVVKQDLTPAPTAPVTGGLAAEMAALKARSQATTTVDPAKPAPVGIGRDNTPLADGGKPFKTKAEADTARKLQPMMRVKKQGKGFVLVEKTAAQIAAQEKSARRNLGSVGAGGGPLSAHAFLASQGGLSKSAMADLGFDRNVRVGSKWLFTNTGMTLEGMTEALQQNGYVQGTEQNPAIEMVRRSANGQPQYTAEGWDQIAQAEATARFEDHLAAQQDAIAEDEDFDPFSPDAIAGDFEGDDLVVAGYDAKKDPIKLEVNALLAKAEALGIDTDTIKETAYEDTKNESEQAYFERVRDELTRAINASTGSRSNQEADGNAQGGQGPDAQQGSRADSREGDGREGAQGTDSEGLTDGGIKIRPGKGLIKGKYLAEVDGVGLPGKPFDSEAEAYDAALKYREVLAQRANEGADAQRRKEAIADKFLKGADVTAVEIELLGLKASTSDMRWFMSRAADLFGLNARQIRPLVKDLIKIRRSDMGTEYEYVPTRKALEAIAASQNEALTAYTPAEVTARQDAAKESEATAKRAEDAAARAEAAAKQASEIAQRSVAAADTFELGGNAEDNLSGQQGLGFSKTDQSPSTPASTIREAITKAYGNLLPRLEGKGLVSLTQTEEEAIASAAQARADQNGGDVEAINESLRNSVAGDELDVKRSSEGNLEGFFDPTTGKSFLIADNLTAESAPGTLMHEVGIHMAADGKLEPLFTRAGNLLKLARNNPFIQRVQARMDQAGETSNEEAAAYIVTEYENDRVAAPESVVKWVKDFIADVRAWLFSKGVLLKADQMTVADIAAVARANARGMARGDAQGGLRYSKASSEQANTTAFKRWYGDWSKGASNAARGLLNGGRDQDVNALQQRGGMEENSDRSISVGEYTFPGASGPIGADGKPVVFFHGTREDFSVFELNHPLRHDNGWLGRGVYVASDPLDAESYARMRRGTGAPNIMPLFVAVKNPFVATNAIKKKLGAATQASIDEFTQSLKDKGHDGVVMPFSDGHIELVAFDPSNVKSATANNGDFDQANLDIRASRNGKQGTLVQQQAATTWDDLGDSRVDELIYEGQDDRIDLKRVQENITKAGRSIREEFDARTAETLLPGRLASRTETFMDIEVKPLMRDMAANNVTMEALSDYMLARHAPERNDQIAKVNPDMPDGGAGTNSQGVLMTTQAANDHIAALTTGKRMALELLARRVDTITKGTRELLVAEGLEKADTVKAWEGAYKHYVPLFRDESAETPGHPIGSGISVTGTSSKRATGSTKEVTNMLAHVLMQREAAITRAEKNRVAMSLYGMALSHPNKGFWSTVQPNMKTADIVAELQRMGVDPMDGIAGMDAAPTIRTVDERTNLVVDRPNPMYKKLDNAIVVKVNGEDRVILFNTKNARAMRLAESLKNQHMDAGVVADAMNSVATVTRFMASMLTQYNPAFGMVNAVRDVQGALVNLSSTELAGKQARVLADTPAAVIGIARDLRGDPKRTPWSDLWVQFQEDGGRTGYRDLVASPYERTANIEKDLKRMQNEGKLTAGNAAHAVLDVLGDFNDSLENGVRLAAYKAALDKGMSRPQAAKLARELTVDFNRKGRTGRELGKLYAFLNASIQGNARTLATLVGKHGGKVMAGGFALGVLQALMLAAAGFEEDEIPEFVKARAFIIPMGGKQYVAIPLALGLHVLPNTSRVLTELMMTGGEDWQTRVPTAMAEIVNAANPLGGGGDWTTLHGPLTMVMPTVLDPVVDLAMNRDFTGKPISRTRYDERTPGADMAREGTLRTPSGQVYLGISEAINSLSGGNARKAGTFSPTPEEVRYVLGVAGGGVFRETEKAINAAVMLVRGDEIKATQVPLGSRFVGEVRDEDVQRTRFYKNSRKLEDLEADLKNARKSQDEAEERRLAKDARTGLIGMNNSVQRRISEINRLARDDIGDRASLVRHDASRADLMRALNDEVRKLEKAAQ